MSEKELWNNAEDHWERMKEDILSKVSKENAFKVDLLIDSIENNLSVIKAILDCKDEVDDDIDDEVLLKSMDIYYTLNIVKYLLKFLDKCEKDGDEKSFYNGDLITSYETSYKDMKSEKYIMKYFKKRGIDIVINKPSTISTSRTVYFKHSNINDVRKVLTEIPIKMLDIKWYRERIGR